MEVDQMSELSQAGPVQRPRASGPIPAGKAIQPGDEDIGQHGNYPLPKCRQALSELLLRDLSLQDDHNQLKAVRPGSRVRLQASPVPSDTGKHSSRGVTHVPELGLDGQCFSKGERAHGSGGMVPAFS